MEREISSECYHIKLCVNLHMFALVNCDVP